MSDDLGVDTATKAEPCPRRSASSARVARRASSPKAAATTDRTASASAALLPDRVAVRVSTVGTVVGIIGGLCSIHVRRHRHADRPDDPLAGLTLGEHPDPQVPDGWTTVTVRAAALNHHDLWTLRGVGLPADRLPMILGCDAAGVDADGNEVVVHAVIGDPTGAATRRSTRGARCCPSVHPGTFAERVAVPRAQPRAQAGRR